MAILPLNERYDIMALNSQPDNSTSDFNKNAKNKKSDAVINIRIPLSTGQNMTIAALWLNKADPVHAQIITDLESGELTNEMFAASLVADHKIFDHEAAALAKPVYAVPA
jgi:hypothetical protein